MAEKRDERKLLGILVVLVVLSLVVDLLSLNALYVIAAKQAAGKGELNSVSSWWDNLWNPYHGYSSYDEYIDSISKNMDPEHDIYSPWYNPNPEPEPLPEYQDYQSMDEFYFCSGDEIWYNSGGSTIQMTDDCGANDQRCIEDGYGSAYCEN
ncbi:MAG: hypothetical protein PHV16_05425 [Candidatus Nanoarchaeia archaeon]|nr:hypothetical protein [Candidatus Nanoarchaeia archaeon]